MSTRKVLTLKYRPQTFAELLIQDHVRNTLTRAIELNRLANAYLFSGPRGVGKTTTARILAKSLNCLSFDKPTTTPCNQCSACIEIAASRSMDVLEIDGASNRGIDQVRELRENIKYAPASLRYKVYIIDEVHMLTAEAFNALLKTLEEPPAHAKFILATTAAHKVPPTIISRCQRFDFRKATPAEIVERLTWIAEREKIKISPEALSAIARRADGAIRDAEGLLEQLATYSPEGVELSHAEELLGLVPANLFFEYAELLATGNARGLFDFIDRLFTSGYDFIEFYTGAVTHFRNLLVAKLDGIPPESGFSADELDRLNKQAARFSREQLMEILKLLSENESTARYSPIPRLLLEIVSLKLLGEKLTPPPQNPPRIREKTNAPNISMDQPPPANEPGQIYRQLCNRLATQKAPLAALLQVGTPTVRDSFTLKVTFPREQKGIILQIEKHQKLIDSILSEIVGAPTHLNATVQEENKIDHIKDKLKKHFGEVEEQ
ncbi:MAG: DNA polymerase III subunit gamma/tau [candidate division WOR-3 bacterium]|nr:DNA polymerase III subunit gamma/tau [candidate division WOR-3 bacterium]